VRDALAAGFRAIDTANQRKHYHEAGVGAALAASGVPRAELFVQTKFTFRDGQDHRLPYDPHAPIAAQVAQSFASSLEHLGLDRLDSLILHGPSRANGLGPEDHEAWRAMEALAQTGRVAHLGVSNVRAAQLEQLAAFATIAPTFVQNRCYAARGWDAEVRGVCAARGIIYQGFSLLTANRAVVAHPEVAAIARRHAKTPEQITLRYARDLGMIALTGTTSRAHMADDLAIDSFALEVAERARITALGGG
jgi:diketogulonate reductase-like aldo/keto reductase